MNMKIEEELESLFLVKGYQWKIDGSKRFPTADEIRQAIEEAKLQLVDEEDYTQLEVGRLIIKKQQGNFDVYVMIGEA